MVALLVVLMLGQTTVKASQGQPGTQGPWPVATSNSSGVRSVLATFPVSCDVTSSHQITTIGTSALAVPAVPTGGRYYVNVCNSAQNAPAALVKCRADGVAPVLASGTPGDVLLQSDCVLYTTPAASILGIQCIADAASRRVTSYECVTATRPLSYTLQETLPLGAPVYSVLPTCNDSSCTAVCGVYTQTGNWQCFDNTGAVMSGMTQGNNSTYVSSFAHSVDGGWFQALNYVDDTVSASAMPRIDNAAIRALFGGSYTILFGGYGTTGVNSTQWWGMITDGTNFLQARGESGAFSCIATGASGTTGASGQALNGWTVTGCQKSGMQVGAWSQNSSSWALTGNTTVAAVTGSNAFVFGGGVGGCCTPGGSMGGPLAWVVFYNTAKSDAETLSIARRWYAAPTLQSGGNGAVGTTQSSPIGRDDLAWSGGGVPIFINGAYITDPVLGARAQLAMQNFWAADPLAAATWTNVGTPGVTSNVSAGPFFRWKNVNECDLIADDDALAFEGKESASAGSTTGWYNASCYLMAGDAGSTVSKARISFVTDGVLDAGSGDCDVTGLDYTVRRYPLTRGCYAWIDNPTSVKARVLVGNTAAATGSITTCQCQVTASPWVESPTVDNTAKGSNWPELDGGGVPSGVSQGKLEAVFQMLSPSTQASPYYLTRNTGAYVFDAYSTGASHSVLLASTVFGTYDGGVRGEPGLQALMYGASQTYENRFEPTPIPLDAGTFYVWSYEWYSQYGLLPDAGMGIGCRGTTRLNTCANPLTCTATRIVGGNTPPVPNAPLLPNGQNSGALGTCIDHTDFIDIGTRIAGSSPSSIWVRELRVYR